MNHTTQRFPRTLHSIDGTSCLGIDGPIIPTRPGWLTLLVGSAARAAGGQPEPAPVVRAHAPPVSNRPSLWRRILCRIFSR